MIAFLCLSLSPVSEARTVIALSDSGNGIGNMDFNMNGRTRNMVDKGKTLGFLKLRFEKSSEEFHYSTDSDTPAVLLNKDSEIQLFWQMQKGVRLYEKFREKSDTVFWTIEIFNRSASPARLTDLGFHLPVGGLDENIPARENYNLHPSVNMDASFLYWAPYSGQGEHLPALRFRPRIELHLF